MRSRGFVAAVSLGFISVSGCSSGPSELPDRAAAATKAEEARVVTVLSADRSVLGEPGVCTVRLLGQSAGASFVWALCQALESSHATSLPLRIDGSKVIKPQDGGAYADSVRTMFPEDLAERILEDQGAPELRPSAVPPSFPGG